MVGKWFEDREKEGRYYYTLKNLGTSDELDADMYRAINMPVYLSRYVRTNVTLSNLELIEDLDQASKLNKLCIQRTFR